VTTLTIRPLVAVSTDSLPLDGGWRFAIDRDGIGQVEGWADPGFDDSGWQRVTLPHTWNTMPEHAAYEALAWYRRSVVVPEAAHEAHVRLRFEAVFYLARVWWNGVLLGDHEGGYTPFEFDVSGIAIPGSRNVIAVQVDNLRATDRLPAHLYEGRSFGWRNYGGIVRPLSLEITSRAFIAGQKIVTTPHLIGPDRADRAEITATVMIRNISTDPLMAVLSADILDDGTGLSALGLPATTPVNLPPDQGEAIVLKVTLSTPKLWHFDHTHLYRWSASLRNTDGEPLHTNVVTFGVRLIELRGARLFLNGESVRLVGLSRHADSPDHGLAEPVAVMAADYDDLKQLNMVFARPVHYPQHEYILDYCDCNGILLIPEVPAWQLAGRQMDDPRLRELERQQLREMIDASFNHPSVWAWSVGNELESDTVAGRAFVRDMVAYARSLDPTRPVGFASYHLLVGRPWADATRYADLVMMNEYFGTWHGPKDALGIALDTVHATWPDKAVIVSEFGFAPHWQQIEGPADIDPVHYYLAPEGTSPESDEVDSLRRQVIVEQMSLFRSRPFVVGAMHWCYQGMMGVVDDARNRRGSWAVLRDEYAPVRIESVSFTPPLGDKWSASVVLRTRGPVGEDMPAYTLRGYSLQWAVMLPGNDARLSQGNLTLPVLEPGATWSAAVEWTASQSRCVLTLSIVRPTGFTVTTRSYNSGGYSQ